MSRLTVEGVNMTLKNNIALTKKAYGIADWNSRHIQSSKTVSVANNTESRKLYKRPENLSVEADKFNVYKNFKYQDLQSIIFEGKAVLVSANGDYGLQLLDSSKEFFDHLSDNINSLDFESDDFVFSLAEYELKKYENDSVWLWPAIAMHEERKQSKTILAGGAANDKLKYSRPVFNLAKIIDKIYSTHGWSFKESGGLDNLCITCNSEYFFATSYQKTLNTTHLVNSVYTLTNLNVNDFENGVVTSSSIINISKTSTQFRLRGFISSDSEMTITFSGTSSPIGTDVLSQAFAINKGVNYYDITTSEFTTDENNNDISVVINGNGTIEFNNTLLYTIVEEQALGDLSGNNLIGYMVKVYDNMPELEQLTLLKNTWLMSGQFFTSDNYLKLLNISNYSVLNKINSVDWSSKFVQESQEITGSVGSYYQKNYLIYTNDDTVPESLGSGRFDINNNTLHDRGNVAEIVFGASNDVEIASVKMGDMNIYSDKERINSVSERIFQYYDRGGGVLGAVFSPLNADLILDKYYSVIIEALKNGAQVLTAKFNLTRSDYLSFDFTKTVYIEYFKSTFLVLSINDYIARKSTEIELLKI